MDFQLLSPTFTRHTKCAGGRLKSKEAVHPPWSTLSPFAQPRARLPRARFAQPGARLPSLERSISKPGVQPLCCYGRQYVAGKGGVEMFAAQLLLMSHRWVIKMGEYSFRRYHRFMLSALSIRCFLLPLYYPNTTGRYRTDISTTTSYLSITFHRRSDGINEASCKAHLIKASEHSYKRPSATSQCNSHYHRPSSTASGYAQARTENIQCWHGSLYIRGEGR